MMNKENVYLGMDVHRDSITITGLKSNEQNPFLLKKIPNKTSNIKRIFSMLEDSYNIKAAYEAGCCGFDN